jgi:hypothetical protein
VPSFARKKNVSSVRAWTLGDAAAAVARPIVKIRTPVARRPHIARYERIAHL